MAGQDAYDTYTCGHRCKLTVGRTSYLEECYGPRGEVSYAGALLVWYFLLCGGDGVRTHQRVFEIRLRLTCLSR